MYITNVIGFFGVDQGMDEVVHRFDQVRRGEAPATDPLQLVEVPPCNGYWYGKPGKDLVG